MIITDSTSRCEQHNNTNRKTVTQSKNRGCLAFAPLFLFVEFAPCGRLASNRNSTKDETIGKKHAGNPVMGFAPCLVKRGFGGPLLGRLGNSNCGWLLSLWAFHVLISTVREV
eukprot:35725-Amphidinium_carterae.1